MKGVQFSHDGVDYVLKAGVNALADFQDRHGVSYIETVAEFEKNPGDFSMFRRLFQGILRPMPKPDQVGDMIDEIGLGRAMEMFGEANRRAFQDFDEPGKDQAPE